ncbi:hypothetical protein PNOK_0553900 [Pyrrhoderma noxium]|uniref:Uncharacterized protein n=1 Tax=Pyrrhoderma noxium TaxID=2282107 RepID=A0A286UGF5_9AGAM|nr:hypothetical protein PNOK_0553900 [Pyrrhoderma noxium]
MSLQAEKRRDLHALAPQPTLASPVDAIDMLKKDVPKNFLSHVLVGVEKRPFGHQYIAASCSALFTSFGSEAPSSFLIFANARCLSSGRMEKKLPSTNRTPRVYRGGATMLLAYMPPNIKLEGSRN